MVVLLNLASKGRRSLCFWDSTCSHLRIISLVLARWALGKRWSTFCRNYDSPVLSCQWPRNFAAWAHSSCLFRYSSGAVNEHRWGLVVGCAFSARINTRWNWPCWLRRWLSWDNHTSTSHIHRGGCIDRRSFRIGRMAARSLLLIIIGLLESIVLLVCIFNLLIEVIHSRDRVLIDDRPRFLKRRVRFPVPSIRL